VSVRILIGDCRDTLRELPDGCVQTVVTSPPYFGLRDYGTGEWEGGDPACDHIGRRTTYNDASTLAGCNAEGQKKQATKSEAQFRDSAASAAPAASTGRSASSRPLTSSCSPGRRVP
jgi:hypothetical protein